MPAEPYSAALVSRLAVPGNHRISNSYFRSKLFINTSTTNPLVAAAGPLLSLLERLCVSPTLPTVNSIRENIEHELHAFRSRLMGQDYADESVLIACYLLSATIDELLGKNYLRLYGQPAEFKAFTPLSHDNIGPQQRFFDITLYIKERTNQYLDLIELSYYCLIAGFEGEKHLQSDGRQTLDNLIEELHQLILQNRVNKPQRLFKEKTAPIPKSANHKPIIVGTLMALSTIISMFFFSHLLLESKAKTLILEHSILAKMDN